jgi:hypothetical protein
MGPPTVLGAAQSQELIEMIRHQLGTALLLLGTAACTGPSWRSDLGASSRQVALALNDPVELPSLQPFDPATVPVFKAPEQVRPCCAFGMDLRAKLGAMPVAGYKNGNIVAKEDLGHHGYGDALGPEHNGLVYTCRGGFIDVAHIRDNADRMLFLATQIARSLPGAFTVTLPDEGTHRRVVVKALPDGMLQREGRWRIATMMAEWASFQLSVWHEIITWYDWESVKGFSEKVSAFTPEDLFSNVLGQHIASGIITNREIRTRDEYNQAMDAWIPEALRRLGAVSVDESRRAMKAIDGYWWDSKKYVTDWNLVIRRYMDTGATLKPWLVTETFPEDQSLRQMCAGQPPVLPLSTPDAIEKKKMDELLTVELEFDGWIPSKFSVPVTKGKTFTPADFHDIIAGIRVDFTKELGAGYDSPRPRGTAEAKAPAPAPSPPAPSPSAKSD